MTTYDLPVNKNGRVYPPDVLRKAIEKAQPRIAAGRMIGEIEPPGDGRSRMSHASHIVRGIRVESDGSIVGTLQVLDTEAGKMLKAMLEQGAEVSAVARGRGTVEGNRITAMDLTALDVTLHEAPEFPPSAVDQMGDLVRDEEDDAND